MRLRTERPETFDVALSGGSVDLEHTAESSFTLDTGYAPELEDCADVLSSVEIDFAPTDAQADPLRMILLRAESDKAAGRTTLEGRGRGWLLERDERSVRYQNIFAFDALADYWSRTQVDAHVDELGPQPSGQDVELQRAPAVDSFGQLLDDLIDATDPFEVDGNSVVGLPVNDIDTTGTGGGVVESLDYVDEIGRDLNNDRSYGVEAFYDIPEPVIAFRRDAPEEHRPFSVHIDGQEVESYPASSLVEGLRWSTINISDVDISSGGFTIEFKDEFVSDEGLPETPVVIDTVCLRDGRFSFNDSNDLDDDLQLPGPELFPNPSEASQLVFGEAQSVQAITDATLDVDEASDEPLPELALSFDSGETFQTATDTFSVDGEANLPTNTVEGRITFGRFGERTGETPTQGFEGHEITFYRIGVDTDARAVIEDQVVTGDDLTNLQNLHDQAKMRFVIDHVSEELQARSFEIGSSPPHDVEWRTINATRDLDLTGYANEFVLKGASKPEDERIDEADVRWSATATNEDEIQRLVDDFGLSEEEATFTRTEIDTRLESLTAVAQQVASKLNDAVAERELTGTLTIQPTLIPPGYRYEIEEFDGLQLDLNTVTFEANGEGTLQFRQDETPAQQFAGVALQVTKVTESL